MNVVVLHGRLSSDPKEKELDSGTLLVRYEVTVRDEEGVALESVPVAWFGDGGKRPGFEGKKGEEVVVCGRVRRRWWQVPGGGRASSTEVTAEYVGRGDKKGDVNQAMRKLKALLPAS